MPKIKVFIDFEAISMPFSKDAKIYNDFPYAYTLGIYFEKKFEVRTFIFDFFKEKILNINTILKNQIIFDIRKILKNPKFEVNTSNIEFIGWSPILEKKILKKLFFHVNVFPLNKGFEISLAKITPEINNNYFEYMKKIINDNLSKEFIKRRSMFNDGAIAAYVGYLLYTYSIAKKGRYSIINFKINKALEELKKYSKDDVIRMHFLFINPKLFIKRKEKAISLISKKNKISKKIIIKNKALNLIKDIDSSITIEDFIKQLTNDIKCLEEEKATIETNFKNL